MHSSTATYASDKRWAGTLAQQSSIRYTCDPIHVDMMVLRFLHADLSIGSLQSAVTCLLLCRCIICVVDFGAVLLGLGVG
jgi:hypothetical protein